MHLTQKRVRPITSALACTLLIVVRVAQADDSRVDGRDIDPAIGGYSPVSYYDPGYPQRGSPEFASLHNGWVYWFVDAEQKARFDAAPEAYEPLFPEHCPYNLDLGRQAAIDPENFRIIDGALLLFHRSEEMDGLEKWRESEADEHVLRRRAEQQFALFRF